MFCTREASTKKWLSVIFNPAGLRSFYPYGGFPCIVPDEQIKAIRDVLHESLDFLVTHDKFEPGDQVVITGGALSGYHAEVVENRGTKSLIIRIRCLAQAMVVTTKFEYVELSGRK